MAYALAKSKLQLEFGQPCIIADICKQRLKEAPQVKSNHPASIKGFSELLEKSLITLQSLKIAGSFNSLDTLTRLVNKLPFEMRRRWVRESVCIEEHTGRVAQFEDLVKFVKHESSEVNSLFGRRVFTTKPETKSVSQADRKKLDSTPYSSFSVEAENYQPKQHGSSPKCWFCQDKAHFLGDCSAFAKLAFKERSEFVKSKGLCYKCLSSKHKTGQCKRTNTCKVQNCGSPSGNRTPVSRVTGACTLSFYVTSLNSGLQAPDAHKSKRSTQPHGHFELVFY